MSIPEISIRRPVFAWMLMLGLILFGAISFNRMGISQLPDVNFPVVNIALELPNAAPEVMESDVVDAIEDAMMGIDGLKYVTSTSSLGVANITCHFQLHQNVDVDLQEVEDRIAQVQNQLPKNLYPPVITKTNPEDLPILWVMVTVDKGISLNRLMVYARNTLKDQLSSLNGVGDIQFRGYIDPQLRVWVNDKKMYKYQLTSEDIINAISAEQIEQPAGRIEGMTKEFNVRVLGETRTPEEFGKIRINTRGGTPNYYPIELSRVARIEEGTDDVRAISRFDGKTAVGLGIVKQHGANAVAVADSVRQKLKELQPTLLPGYHVAVDLDTTQFIKDSVHELDFTLILSAILTSIVCFLFLGSWSSTINVILSIPTSVVGTFIALYFLGFTLNTFTLLGLSLAIGIIVDDAIMMLENIVRHYEMGKNRRQAALDGANEIAFAAIAATLAIAAIFVPVVFMRGAVGRFFYQYGVTVTVAVFLSLLEALTLTPMRCSQFLAVARESPGFVLRQMDQFMNFLADRYRRSLYWTLDHKTIVLGCSLAFFAASLVALWGLPSLGIVGLRKELMPKQDQSLFLLNIKAPVGTAIQETDKIFDDAENYLRAQPEVAHLYTTVGDYEDNNIVNAGQIYVILTAPTTRKATQKDVMSRVDRDLPLILNHDFKSPPDNIEVFSQDLSLTGFTATRGYPIELIAEGADWNKLSGYAQQILAKMKSDSLLRDVNTDYQTGMPEIRVIPNRDLTAKYGVAVSDVGTEVSTMIGGNIFTSANEYPEAGHRYYIQVRSEPDEHSRPSDVDDLLIRNNRGEVEPLTGSSKIVSTTALQLITRLNRQRAVPIYANVADWASQETALESVEKIGHDILPAGYRLLVTGSAKEFRDAFSSLIFALLLGIAVAYMVLASQFNSFIHPITVLMALPFSLSGALIALYFTHQSLNLFSMIGLILLMGIVKKNSILLVDFTNQRRAEGLTPKEALIQACPIRLRPIIMTSVATVAGALPGAMNLGPGAETRVPMAIAIIGGVTVSTLLTLYAVPCVYSLLTHLERHDREDLRSSGAV